MRTEPTTKRTIAFFDGQNLFHAVKKSFGYTYPNFDAEKLARQICQTHNWDLIRVRFYTGIPDASDNANWNHFWTAKLAQMGRQNIHVFSRPLRYRNETVHLPDGKTYTALVGQEKGIDVRLAIDIVRCVQENACDVALVFSQDQDLSEVADEIKAISNTQDRWIKMASAYPSSPANLKTRGINGAEWIKIDRATYDLCLDQRDYRIKSP